MQSEPKFVTSREGQEKCSPWMLFAMPIGVGVVLGLVITIVNVLRSIDTRAFYLGLDGLRPYLLGIAISIVTASALILWFRPKLRTILAAATGCGLLGFVAYKSVRVESFYGNMVPRLAWSWTPTAEEQVEEYFVSRSSDHRTPNNIDAMTPSDVFAPTVNDFPGFLGAKRNGEIDTIHLDTDWASNPPVKLWRHPVGLGWSSFAVVGQAAINLEQRGEQECVVCYNALTGEELWCHQSNRRFEDEHGDGPRSTPTVANGRVFSMGADGLLTCLDLETGELVWEQETLSANQENLLWGMSGSPLVIEDRVIVTPGGEYAAAICYSAVDGAELWRSGSDPGGYASPMIANICGERQLLVFNGSGLRAFDPDGRDQWFVPWLTQGELQRVNVAQPIVVPSTDDTVSRVLISSGYGNGTALFEVKKSQREATNAEAEPQWHIEQRWLSRRLKSKMSNFVVHGQHVYGLDSGILTCISLEDGERLWKKGRYGHGQMLLVDGNLLIQTESGQVVLVAASPNSHQLLGTLEALDGKTWNNLALAGDLLLVRNDHEAAAFRLPTHPNSDIH